MEKQTNKNTKKTTFSKPNLKLYAHINVSIAIPLAQPTKQGNNNLHINTNILLKQKRRR